VKTYIIGLFEEQMSNVYHISQPWDRHRRDGARP